ETLEHGMRLFDDIAAKSGQVIPGADAFRLYDTYGFPVDLTADIARERGLTVDMDGFEQSMREQQERSREGGKFEAKGQMPAELASQLKPTEFLGYDTLHSASGRVVGIVRGGKQFDQLSEGEDGYVILDRTPFYAQSGGQVGDTGTLATGTGRFAVEDTFKMGGVFFGHAGRWHGTQPLRVGDAVDARVDDTRRQAIVLNHSATHLLHAALRKLLGDHVAQKGSEVAPERLRFDFSHFKPLSHEEIAQIEAMVNAEVRRNAPAEIHHMGYNEALDFGAIALFGEKYGDEVRVLKMGEFSTELCGGTHVGRTGDIGLFKIVSEAGVAAGVRRIEAVTGAGALAYVADEERRLGELSQLLSSSGDDAVEKLKQIFDKQKKLERELESLRSKAAGSATADLAGSAKNIDGIRVVAARLEGFDAKALRDSVDQLKQQLADCVVLLAGAAEGRVSLVAGVHGSALGRIKAGDVVAYVAAQIDGKGGGRPDMAQGGGSDTAQLPMLLAGLPDWIGTRLTAA
ncbi:MAG TPA: alanine--tRNA ligase, partial [Dyella sp.]|uniref:alanine--tRNA ligase n=1 Tax=Dyella sp. TaxID=1869338 RepID=UPI002F93F726